MQAGLQHACGNLIFLIDCDLEISPLVLVELQRKLRESDCDMVFGYQENRKGAWFEQVSGNLFWKGFNFLSDDSTFSVISRFPRTLLPSVS